MIRKTILTVAAVLAFASNAIAQDKPNSGQVAWGKAMEACLIKACNGYVTQDNQGRLTGFCPGRDHQKNQSVLGDCAKQANESLRPARWSGQ